MTRKSVSLKAVFDHIGYKPHPAQRQIHMAANTSRWRTVCAGRRTGKSLLGGHEFTADAMFVAHNQSMFDKFLNRWESWIVGPEYSDAEKEFRVLYSDLERLGVPFDKPGTYYDANGGNMHISAFGGKFLVHAKSSKYPDTLVGEKLRRVIIAEAAKQKPSVWYKYIRPTLADYRGSALLTSTPEGMNWYYEMYMDGLDPDKPDFWSIRVPSWSNPVLFPGGREDPEIKSMAEGMSAEKFNQEIGAEFAEFEGAVFKDFDEEIHTGRFRYDSRRGPVYICTDYGFTNPTVVLFLQVDVWDNVYVIAEFYRSGMTPEEVGAEIKSSFQYGDLVSKAKMLFPDPEDPAASRTLSRAWNVNVSGGTGGLISDRINLIRRWLKVNADGLSKLNIDLSCTNLIREMNVYRYPEKPSSKKNQTNENENPLKKDDHAPEALGRFFRGHFGPRELRGRSRQRSSITKR